MAQRQIVVAVFENKKGSESAVTSNQLDIVQLNETGMHPPPAPNQQQLVVWEPACPRLTSETLQQQTPMFLTRLFALYLPIPVRWPAAVHFCRPPVLSKYSSMLLKVQFDDTRDTRATHTVRVLPF